MLVNIDEIYDLALKAKDDPYGHPVTQVLDNFDNFRCLLTPSFLIELISLIREAEKDAERYRWLRDIARHECDVDDFFGGSSDGVDGMIDKAMKEKGDE